MKALLVIDINDKKVEDIRKIEYSVVDGLKHLWIHFKDGEYTFSNDCILRNADDYEPLNNKNVMFKCDEFKNQEELLSHIIGDRV